MFGLWPKAMCLWVGEIGANSSVSPARVHGRVERGNTVLLLKKKAPLIFIQNSRRAEGGNLACQQLSQGNGSLPEFGGKPQLGVNGTVNELMLAAGGQGRAWLGGACARRALPAHRLQLPARLQKALALGAMCLGRCKSPLPVVSCSPGWKRLETWPRCGGEDPPQKTCLQPAWVGYPLTVGICCQSWWCCLALGLLSC